MKRREPNIELGCDQSYESGEEEGSAEAGCKITCCMTPDGRKGIQEYA